MKLKKNYLTAEEINVIVNEVCKLESAIDREVLTIALIAQFVIEDLGEFEDCSQIYNKLVENNDIEILEHVNNLYTVYDLIEEELGINKFLKDFLKGIEEKLDNSINNIDLNSAIEKLSNIAENQPKPTRKKKAE